MLLRYLISLSRQPVMTVAVITGATSGLDRLVALDLARRGMRLAVVARDPDKTRALRREIPVDCFLADLASLRDVRRAAAESAARYDRIDLLVNNAGAHTFAQRVTDEGLAKMTAVNYLPLWLLTATLRDKLARSARIVNVTSEAARQTDSLDPVADIASTAAFSRRESLARYGRTKLMDITFTQELARRMAGTGVTVNCCDPGFNTTGLGRGNTTDEEGAFAQLDAFTAAGGTLVDTAHVALAWLLARPLVSAVLLGAGTLDQLTSNLELDIALASEEASLLDAVSAPEVDFPAVARLSHSSPGPSPADGRTEFTPEPPSRRRPGGRPGRPAPPGPGCRRCPPTPVRRRLPRPRGCPRRTA
jgi:NAD(P)-dependent dehydrogenase (short-subunit alcohol dehydrogenase family)